MCFRPNDVSMNEAPTICPECGMENAPGEPKCIFCGAEMVTMEAPSAPAAPGAPHTPSAPSAPKPN